LIHATTAQSTPFHVSTHAMDSALGNMAIIGPMRSGKTVMMNFMRLMWRKYAGARGVGFDFKRGMRPTTLCLGGQYLDLGKSGPALQPLGRLETRAARDQAEQWLFDRMVESHVALTSEVRAYLRVGLDGLEQRPPSQRTLSTYHALLVQQSNRVERTPTDKAELGRKLALHLSVREALEGFLGSLLDGGHEAILDTVEQCYEWETLMDKADQVAPTLSHLWPTIEASFQGEPTLFCIDELKRLMVHPLVVERLDKGIRLWPFRNVCFVAATQFVEDLLDPVMGPIFQQSFPTKLLLPNPAALTDICRTAYRSIGITEAQLPIIAAAHPNADYFLVSEEGSRLFRCRLDGTALDVCGRASLADQRAMDEVLAAYGREGFWQAWLRYCHGEEI
jgi:type IV secretion system protein VirB4